MCISFIIWLYPHVTQTEKFYITMVTKPTSIWKSLVIWHWLLWGGIKSGKAQEKPLGYFCQDGMKMRRRGDEKYAASFITSHLVKMKTKFLELIVTSYRQKFLVTWHLLRDISHVMRIISASQLHSSFFILFHLVQYKIQCSCTVSNNPINTRTIFIWYGRAQLARGRLEPPQINWHFVERLWRAARLRPLSNIWGPSPIAPSFSEI